MYVMGLNKRGCLGLGSELSKSKIIDVRAPYLPLPRHCEESHNVRVMCDVTESNACGRPATHQAARPGNVPFGCTCRCAHSHCEWTASACLHVHNDVVRVCRCAEDGTVYTWGWGGNAVTGGALGQGQWEDSPTPRLVSGALVQRKVVSVSAGYQHTVALDCTRAPSTL